MYQQGPDRGPIRASDVPEVPEAPVRPSEVPVTAASPPTYNYRLERIIWFTAGVVDVLIALRFVFKALGASSASSFVAFVYELTQPLVVPFWGIFRTAAASGYVFEPESLVAMLVYGLVGWGLVSLIRISGTPRRARLDA